jgi:hypothetical protein
MFRSAWMKTRSPQSSPQNSTLAWLPKPWLMYRAVTWANAGPAASMTTPLFEVIAYLPRMVRYMYIIMWKRCQVGPEVGPTAAVYSCVHTGRRECMGRHASFGPT